MDILVIMVVFSVFAYSEAIKCHDCTSWNPYCRETVNEPFRDAVATVECEKTKTCFFKKEKTGVISRGCTDWWMESQIDIHYTGCQIQEVPWLGKQTWCFCKTDFCNGGSIEMMEAGISHQEVKQNVVQNDGQGWSDFEWPQWDNELSQWSGGALVDKPEVRVFDDTNPHYSVDAEYNQDPAWQLWWWHAGSDRPKYNDFERTWKTPKWIDNQNALAWDFPITSDVGTKDIQTTTEHWNFGRGAEHILPWWSGKQSNRLITGETGRTTPSTLTPKPTVSSIHSQSIQQNDGENTAVENVEKDEGTNDVDIQKAEFFCWDCYSDSPLCGEQVDTVKAHYLGKTPCVNTNKCFVRKQGDVIYRGCADGWTNSVINQDYVGCQMQKLWGKPVEWCFCTASLCNGDSMTDIQDKYLNHEPQLFKGNMTTAGPSTVNVSRRKTTTVETNPTTYVEDITTPQTLTSEKVTLSHPTSTEVTQASRSTKAAVTDKKKTTTTSNYTKRRLVVTTRKSTAGTSTEKSTTTKESRLFGALVGN